MITIRTLLCITRAYPPVLGGMERLSFEFTNALAKKCRVILVANRHGKRALALFLPWAAFRIWRLSPKVQAVHLGDPLLTVLTPFVRAHAQTSKKSAFTDESRFSGRNRPYIAVTLHGLDLLFPHPLYQTLLRRFLPRVDLAFCISEYVARLTREHFPRVRTVVLTPGLQDSFSVAGKSRGDLQQALGRTTGNGPLLLTVARLVPRKGIRWFVEAVLPQLPDTTLLVIGDGPERAAIADAAARRSVTDRLILRGSLPREQLKLAYSTADLLVMPNVPVPGDAEGFGLVALEAASAGLPVVASNLEGIPDAVIAGKTGVLVPPGDARAWVGVITGLIDSPSRREALSASARESARGRFSWDQRAEQALQVFTELSSQ